MKKLSTVQYRLLQTILWLIPVALCCFGIPLPAVAQDPEVEHGTGKTDKSSGSFAAIVADNPAEYGGYQIKLTWVSIQTVIVPTLLLHGSDRQPDISEFLPYRTDGMHYTNDSDDLAVKEFEVGGNTIRKFVEGLQDRPEYHSRGDTIEPFISLMIERGAPPSEVVFEHLADLIGGGGVIDVLQAAARTEPDSTRDYLRRFRNFTVGPR